MLRLSFFLFISSFSLHGYSQENQSIGLKQFIDAAVNADPEIKSIFNETEQASFTGDIGLPSAHPVLQNSSQYGIDPESDDKTHSISTTLSKPFHDIGSKVELKHTITNSVDREEQVTGITYEQQLLKNAFGRDYELQKESAAFSDDIIQLQAADKFEARIETLFSVYFDYQLASLSVNAIRQQMVDAKKLHNFVLRKAKSAVASDIDVARSEHQVLLKQTELEQLEHELANHQKSVLLFTGNQYQPKLKVESKNTQPLADLVLSSTPKKNDRQLKIFDLQEKQAERTVLLAERSTSAELAAFVGAQSDKSTRFGSESNKAEVIVGLNVSVPLGPDSSKEATKRKAIYEKSAISFERQQHISERTDLAAQLSGIVSQQLSLIKINTKRLANARKIAQGEDDRYRKGRIDLERLISAQDLVTSAELSTLKHQIALRKTVVQWLAATDQLTNQKGVAAPWSLLE
jgi:outer membrane protein TolC